MNFSKKLVGQKSYSQSGEDIIANRVLGRLGFAKPYYLDLGGYHPIKMSNTYHFYEKGCTGVVVEANPLLINEFKKNRKRDNILNIGVGTKKQDNLNILFYIFENQSVSTFSEVESKKLINKGEVLLSKSELVVKSLNSIIKQDCEKAPHYISMDLEGIDYDVLKDFDFQTYRPKVWCIETILMPEEKKNIKIFGLLESNGYMVYADTYINTIFVDKESWYNRR